MTEQGLLITWLSYHAIWELGQGLRGDKFFLAYLKGGPVPPMGWGAYPGAGSYEGAVRYQSTTKAMLADLVPDAVITPFGPAYDVPDPPPPGAIF